jgi:hypothetical protein
VINVSEKFKKAIVADSRRMVLRAAVDIIDPNIVISGGTSSGETEDFSHIENIFDKEFNVVDNYASLELNRWLLDGSIVMESMDNTGFVSYSLADENDEFAVPQWVELQFSNVSILQACSIYFPDVEIDGLPVDFTVDIMQGGTSYHTAEYTDNTASQIGI